MVKKENDILLLVVGKIYDIEQKKGGKQKLAKILDKKYYYLGYPKYKNIYYTNTPEIRKLSTKQLQTMYNELEKIK